MAYGLAQVVFGPIGDRYGKIRVIVWMLTASGGIVALGALAPDLISLAALRFLAGIAASAVIPLAMAHIGDVVAYDERQPVLARLMIGMSLGLVSGQALGGILGDLFGWRPLFFGLGALFLVLALVLRRATPVPSAPRGATSLNPRDLFTRYQALWQQSAWVRAVIICVFIEGMLFFGCFAFLSPFLFEIHGLGFSEIGLVLAGFGLGSLVYSAFAGHVVRALGQRGMVAIGGVVLALCLGIIPLVPAGLYAAGPVLVIGFGFYLMHNTLQTNATQMAPDQRGTAVALFAATFFVGQAFGVWLVATVLPLTGYGPPFWVAAAGLAVLGFWFRQRLGRVTVHMG
jgi:predicted MFS family arabinose efflux permease